MNLYSGLVVASFTFEALHSVLFLPQTKETCTHGVLSSKSQHEKETNGKAWLCKQNEPATSFSFQALDSLFFFQSSPHVLSVSD